MRLGSIIDVSLSDVPGKPVTVIFTGGCNFRCPYCQNSELIPLDSGVAVPLDEIVRRSQGHLTDGYCITGGEPTVHKDLPDLLALLREERGKHINLNTQGSVPTVLRRCLTYLDSVWFDMKTRPDSYPRVTGCTYNPWPSVRTSIEAVLDSHVAFWPRTTYASGLLSPDDILEIAHVLSELGFKGQYTVQNYVPRPSCQESEAMRRPQLDELKDLQNMDVNGVRIRLNWS
ncbi:MAG: anaerobic ribonucleoside-triphosphate reductase activating protein [Candidatus Thorarchaeota archaeon]|nr:anaerobic ribonucleoside-triphosphate reductase activating protein [Candidatus Thorarchaeota archaeon]